jgi:hypothetical protein
VKLAYAIAAIFFSRLLVSALFEPGRDADLAWQQFLGNHVLAQHALPTEIGMETFTAPGAHWVPQEWAFSTAVAWAGAHGAFPWLALLTALAATLAILVTAYRARVRGASTIAIGITTICAGFSMLQSFGARAQVFGWLCLAVLMLLLDLENAWLYLAIPVVAIWANLHASAAIAPVLAGAWTIGTWIEDRAWTARVRRNAILTAGCVLALCATPLSLELPGYAVTLVNSPFRSTIQEWQPTGLFDTAFYAGVLPLVAIAAYFGIAAPRERWRDGMLFALTVPLAFMAVRHLPVCGLVIAPMAAQRLSTVLTPYVRINAVLDERFSQWLIAITATVASIVVALDLTHTPAIAAMSLPKTPIAQLTALPGEHKLFCEDFAWCSLALETPNVRAFIDGRCDPYPASVWNDYMAIERLHPDWKVRLDRSGADAVLVRRGYPLAQALRRSSGWRRFYRDSKFEIFLRGDVQTAQREHP